tara:strand:+ start:19 stop:345 length:327 start_codon:yes stop_codon:yes gene_type:complete
MSDIVKDKVNLNNLGKPLTETVYSKFSGQVRGMMLDLYFGGFDIPLHLMGSTTQVESFMKTLRGEKRYMDSYLKNGLNDPKTMSSKYSLLRSVEKFEKETGLRWPFKN